MIKRAGLIGLTLILALFTIGSEPLFAEIELPVSRLNAPLTVLNGDDFEVDYDKDKNSGKPEGTGLMGDDNPRKISKTKAVLYSLLIPGAGQFYADAGDRGEIFLGAEVAIWVGYFAFNTYGHWKEDDYVNYAVRNAGIDPDGKDDEFFRNLTFYDSREEYNSSGRIIDPSSPYYAPNSGYDWYWTSEDDRLAYRSIRNASKTSFRKATFMIGMAVFNRILSGIDAFRVAQKKSQEIKGDDFFGAGNFEVDLKGNPFDSDPDIGIRITRRF